jgi:nucleoside-diphosphate-sugar epimerase
MATPRILLTGASGFIGSHLVKLLNHDGYEVHALVRELKSQNGVQEHKCDLSDREQIRRAFATLKPDFFVHLASRAKPGRDLKEMDAQVEETLKPCLNLANEIPEPTKLAIFFGSSEEYGNGSSPFREDQNLISMSPYGWAKISAYYATQMILSQRKVQGCWVRPFLTFGPGQKPEFLLSQLIAGCLKNEKIDLTPGEQTRDLIYVEDLCRMILTLLKNPAKAAGQTLNLCTMEPRSVRSIAELVRDLVGRGELNFGALSYRTNEAMSCYGSNEKFVGIFGAPTVTPFAEALRKTIQGN